MVANAEDEWVVQQEEGKAKEVSDHEDEVSSNEEDEISDSGEKEESSVHPSHQTSSGGYKGLPSYVTRLKFREQCVTITSYF